MSLSDIGSYASILGFLLTVAILVSLRNIQKKFLFKVRISDLHHNIKKHASELSSLIQNYSSNKNEIEELLAKALADIASLEQKASGSLRQNLKVLSEDIKKYRSNHSHKTKSMLRDIYTDMNLVIQEIYNIREDAKWGLRND